MSVSVCNSISVFASALSGMLFSGNLVSPSSKMSTAKCHALVLFGLLKVSLAIGFQKCFIIMRLVSLSFSKQHVVIQVKLHVTTAECHTKEGGYLSQTV